MATLLSIDAGTTGVRALLIDERGHVLDLAYRELTQFYPQPGWVEHDAAEIWRLVCETTSEVVDQGSRIDAIGITNQRETVVAWDRSNGRLLSPAPVWQDKRTAGRCEELRATTAASRVREQTGLVLDPYFSATKMQWLLESGRLDGAAELAIGTVDSWILWNLTGGERDGIYATDPSNASRTLLYDLDGRAFSAPLSDLFGVPSSSLASIAPSAGRFGLVATDALPHLRGVPVSGILGDQQAALFGQRCFQPGMVKATYGTGAFVLATAGPTRPALVDGLLTTVAWDLGAHGGFSYALEGSAFIAGAAVQWLRDELGIIASASELEPLARSASSAEGLNFIPAFAGLGSPWWDDTARGALTGITRGSGRAQLANAVIDSLAYEVRAITDQMREGLGLPLTTMRVDGGAAAMNLLLERQATQSGLIVARPSSLESTAIGAALVAALGEGVIDSLDVLSDSWSAEEEFVPGGDRVLPDLAYDAWLSALERSKDWA